MVTKVTIKVNGTNVTLNLCTKFFDHLYQNLLGVNIATPKPEYAGMIKVTECQSTNNGNKTVKMSNLRGRKAFLPQFLHFQPIFHEFESK